MGDNERDARHLCSAPFPPEHPSSKFSASLMIPGCDSTCSVVTCPGCVQVLIDCESTPVDHLVPPLLTHLVCRTTSVHHAEIRRSGEVRRPGFLISYEISFFSGSPDSEEPTQALESHE